MRKKYALVTGASSGLGREMSQYLVEEGYIVFGASRRGSFFPHQNFVDLEMDVTDESSIAQAFDEISRETHGLHLVVNNAGIFEMASFDETDIDLFRDHIETNIVGSFLVLKATQSFLIENVTHVVTISSIAGKRGFPNVSAYCASKFGLNGLIESVQQEWKKLGIRFTSLFPGAIDTPIWESVSDCFERDNMLDPEDFIHVFDMIVKSPINMQFPDITFLHKSGLIE